MSAMLALRCAAPAFALVAGATLWVMAGPMSAGLALVIFILGVVTSELQHLRWSRVEETELASGEPEAAAASLEPEPVDMAVADDAPPAPALVPIAPRRNFQCTCEALAIGSGRRRIELVERSRRHATRPASAPRRKPEPAPAGPPRPAEARTLRFRAAYEARLTA